MGPRVWKFVAKGREGSVWRSEGLCCKVISLQDLPAWEAELPRRLAHWRELGLPHRCQVERSHLLLFSPWTEGAAFHSIQGTVEEKMRFLLSGAEVYARQIARCAGQPLFHGDLSPGNLIVNQASGEVNWIDWSEASGGDRAAVRATVAYTAPERLAGGAATAAADVYSLGAMAYEVAVGVVLAAGEASDVAAWRSCRKKIPRRWRTVIGRAIHPFPWQRQKSVQGFASGMRRALVQPVATPASGQRGERKSNLWASSEVVVPSLF